MACSKRIYLFGKIPPAVSMAGKSSRKAKLQAGNNDQYTAAARAGSGTGGKAADSTQAPVCSFLG